MCHAVREDSLNEKAYLNQNCVGLHLHYTPSCKILNITIGRGYKSPGRKAKADRPRGRYTHKLLSLWRPTDAWPTAFLRGFYSPGSYSGDFEVAVAEGGVLLLCSGKRKLGGIQPPVG